MLEECLPDGRLIEI
jgi:hypothetical protein